MHPVLPVPMMNILKRRKARETIQLICRNSCDYAVQGLLFCGASKDVCGGPIHTLKKLLKEDGYSTGSRG